MSEFLLISKHHVKFYDFFTSVVKAVKAETIRITLKTNVVKK